MQNKLGFETLNDEIFQSQLKAKYKSKVFIGSFQEKRLCEALKVYRDTIYIDSKNEKDIVKDLNQLLTELREHVTTSRVFVGITQTEESCTIWTEVEDQLPFGTYWFQVSNMNRQSTYQFTFYVIQCRLRLSSSGSMKCK